ncbi:GTP cyclohydrolase subunit MoaA [Russula earlei]|uniref:GTP cyclohydrolase subunit MoaA n=1 Tax=Russula earlei TaxID=71964 RepID=A0ACC0TW10_9AGAM|nr:GTP cyclohydrolase subunit MoaA [Russula earlei]
MLIDSFNRIHTYLRISLTDNCNLRCFYCMPEEEYAFMPSARLMQAHEIETLAKIFVDLGVTKIRLTGGEPLVRKDAGAIIRSLAQLPVTLTLSTNGIRLQEHLPAIKAANITSINISLDTLKASQFRFITRRDNFQQVWDNIHLLIQQGIHVKVNAVAMKGINDQEIHDFVEWTKHTPVHVRFIEFMPFSGNQWSSNKVFTWQEILQLIESKYTIERLQDEEHDTAKHYRVPGHAGTFAVISTMSAPFCSTCNRMRLTADGKMKNCLFSKGEIDLLQALRKGEDVKSLIIASISQKAAERGGQFVNDFTQLQSTAIENRSMIAIGG